MGVSLIPKWLKAAKERKQGNNHWTRPLYFNKSHPTLRQTHMRLLKKEDLTWKIAELLTRFEVLGQFLTQTALSHLGDDHDNHLICESSKQHMRLAVPRHTN